MEKNCLFGRFEFFLCLPSSFVIKSKGFQSLIVHEFLSNVLCYNWLYSHLKKLFVNGTKKLLVYSIVVFWIFILILLSHYTPISGVNGMSDYSNIWCNRSTVIDSNSLYHWDLRIKFPNLHDISIIPSKVSKLSFEQQSENLVLSSHYIWGSRL